MTHHNADELAGPLDALLAYRHGDKKHLTQEHARLLYESFSRHPQQPQRDLSGPVECWDVTVSINGISAVTIGPAMLSGADNIGDYADTVREAARHLLSFIGHTQQPQGGMVNEAQKLATELKSLRALCEPDCEGRCNACPQEVVGRVVDFLAALPSPVAEERGLDALLASGPSPIGEAGKAWQNGARQGWEWAQAQQKATPVSPVAQSELSDAKKV